MTAVPTQLPERSVTLNTVVVGGPGAGKTTFVNSASDIRTLSTDEPQTGAAPATTTVALDFGRATVAHGDLRLELALFAFPGQERFSFLWSPQLAGARAGLVLLDIRSPLHAVPSITRMTQFGLPFVVAVNRFPDTPDHTPSQVRNLLRLPDSVPVLTCDARERASALNALTVLGDCLATLRLLT